MAKILKLCDCSNSCLAEVGQSLVSGKLSWYCSFRCQSCGKATEIDGDDDIPIEIREAILEQDDRWGLEIDEEARISLVLSILRKELNLPLHEIAKLRNLIPGIGLTGTKVEMFRLKEILNINNVTTSVIRLGNN